MKRLSLDTEDFAWRVWREPEAILVALSTSSTVGNRPRFFARRAAAWQATMCGVEAKNDAERALARGAALDPESHVRALLVLTAIASTLGDFSGARVLHEKLNEVLWRSGLAFTDLHVASALNRATWRAHDTADSEVHLAFRSASSVLSRTTYRHSRLRNSRYLLLRFLQAAFRVTHDRPGGLSDLLDLLQGARASNEPCIEALTHSSLATIYREANLYSASLTHSEAAIQLWSTLGRIDRADETTLELCSTLKRLGRLDLADARLGQIERDRSTSRGAYIDARILMIRADTATYRGDRAEAHVLAIESARNMPALVMNSPLEPQVSWIAAAIAASQDGEEGYRREALCGLAVANRAESVYPIWQEAATIIETALNRKPEEADRLAAAFRTRYPDFQAVDGLSMDETLAELMAQEKAAPTSLETDLSEFWGYIRHLSGEDNEDVRAQFRQANCLPVLHRILTQRQPLAPELQFELIELVRYGSVASILAPISGGSSKEPALRRLARRHREQHGLREPSVYGEPRPLTLGNAGATQLAVAANAHPVDVDSLVGKEEDGEPSDLLQLYLLGSTLHWVYHRPGVTPTRGKRQISHRALVLLAGFPANFAPRLGPFENRLFAESPIAEPMLKIVAAARVAMGPMVGDRQLAADLLWAMSPGERSRVWRSLTTLEANPSVADIQLALAELIPEIVFADPAARRLMVSTNLEIATLPLGIAKGADWPAAFLERRVTAVLPPLNLLLVASSHDEGPNFPDRAWQLRRIDNARGDLAFAGLQTSPSDALAALVNIDASAASTTALVYRGHLVEPGTGGPSQAGVFLSATAAIRARDILSDTNQWRTPARVALLACRAAGWDLGGEWEGFASAIMLRGTRHVVAPLWPLIDSHQTLEFDKKMTEAITTAGPLSRALNGVMRGMFEDWMSNKQTAVPPHWWASIALMSR